MSYKDRDKEFRIESGYDFYKVQRDPAGVLHMARVVEDTHVEDISEEVRA